MPDYVSWIIFAVIVGGLLAVDLFIFHRDAHAVTMREAAHLGRRLGRARPRLRRLDLPDPGGDQWCASTSPATSSSTRSRWTTSSSSPCCSRYFAVPPQYQHRLLFWGVLGAIVFRAIFILAGTALLESFHFVIYIFGALLLFTAWRMVTARAPTTSIRARTRSCGCCAG